LHTAPCSGNPSCNMFTIERSAFQKRKEASHLRRGFLSISGARHTSAGAGNAASKKAE
jgi:hypothetical protein